jgi:hypothetical protein
MQNFWIVALSTQRQKLRRATDGFGPLTYDSLMRSIVCSGARDRPVDFRLSTVPVSLKRINNPIIDLSGGSSGSFTVCILLCIRPSTQ